MTWPTRPPVHDSAAAICQPRRTSARPRPRAASSSAASDGARLTRLAIVRELERHGVVERAQVGDDRLELVLRLRRDSNRVALDHGLGLREGIADPLRELLRLLAHQPTLEADLLPDRPAGCRLKPPPFEDLQAQAPPHGL